MKTFPLTVSTPDGNLFQGQIDALFLRGAEGDLAVLAGHIPFVTTVQRGECRIDMPDGSERRGKTDGGILSVTADGTTLLAGSFMFI